MEQVKYNLLTLTGFLIILFVFFKLFGPLPLIQSNTSTNLFQATGTGKATIKPDSTTVNAGVSYTGAAQTDVQSKMNLTINSVVAAVKSQGVDAKDIQTTNYSVTPNTQFLNGTEQQNGFQANTNLTIKVRDLSKLNAIIDAATKAGATNVINSGFGTTDDTTARNKAREQAIADAKQKAQNTAKAAGFTLGKIVNYQESDAGSIRQGGLLRTLDTTTPSVPTQIQTGTNEVDLTVTLTYEIR